ncbi:DUF2190 family protein [Undibacterium aquatile]|uniref:DUF2190 family protein n=1 Tax=Undibacterium aquatile TaxID=1537398 RepID=A0ABR6XJK7_9BURK|nr:DUF2190 family protein [Undibacterium aquatile]MBC3813099.1 DUF2190 family protein [Undibacterium aquatile]
MKTQQVILTISILAMVDLSARRFVGFDGNVCAAGTKALGVVEAGTEAGGVAPANVNGIILVEAGAAIPAGAEVQVDATGRAIPKAAGISNGYAWDAAVAAGDLIRIVRGI